MKSYKGMLYGEDFGEMLVVNTDYKSYLITYQCNDALKYAETYYVFSPNSTALIDQKFSANLIS